jgi:ABC-type glycerol-3-phosphate transport system permease component
MPAVKKGLHIKIGRSAGITVSVKSFIFTAFMLAFVWFMALPIIYVVSTSLKPLDELLRFPPKMLVIHPTLNNFRDLTVALSGSAVPFLRYIFNSGLITVATVVLSVVLSCMASYAIVKINIPGSKVITFVVISALMFSSHVTTIPTYLIINALKLVNSPLALIIPKIASPFALFLVMQFTGQLPDPLLEAARVDGANHWTIFWKIVMPFLAPAWSTLAVFSFVSNWNDFISPLIYITSEAKKTLPLALQSISTGGLSRMGATAATTFLMMAPTIIIFTVAQKKVIQTMAHSGIK